MVLIYFCFVVFVVCQVPTDQRNALIDLYNSTSGQSWKNNGGWTISDPCTTKWFGVTCFCSNNTCTIQSLQLTSNQLSGTIPESIGNLYDLTGLILYTNQLSGTIPASIGNLTKLVTLDIDTNPLLSGTIPDSIGNLTSLTKLDLYSSQLSGTIPESIGKLIHLSYLAMYVNQLSGTIPESIGKLIHLTYLSMYSNQFSGTLPESIGNLHSLVVLSLDENQLSGTIPASIGNLSYLTKIALFSSQLSGTIPESFGNLSSLLYLDLNTNQFSGTIPESIGNLYSLTILNLFANQLSGTIPESIGNLHKLVTLELDTNQLSGTIPVSIGNLHKLTILNLDANQLSGTIPESIGNLTSLVSLFLEFNQLSGTIPESIGELTILIILDLDSNQLSGTIPESIGKLISLTILDLHYNQLSGTIPESIGELTDLTTLDLHANQLSGTIPLSIFKDIIKLGVLMLSDNMFSCFGSGWNTSVSPYSKSKLTQCSFTNNDFDCYIGESCDWIDPFSTWNITKCPFPCSSLLIYNPPKKQLDTGSIVGIICGVVVFLLIFVVIVFLIWKKCKGTSIQLPPEITWSFDEAKLGGEKRDNIKIKLLAGDSKSHKIVTDMFYNKLNGKNIAISEIYAVYPKHLLDAFVIFDANLQYRLQTRPQLFQNQQWKKNDENGLRQWMMDRFDKFVNSFSWNNERNCKIIPQVHGTNFDTAMAICNSGFATLSLLDAGWYGRGIYFSSSAVYLAPYFATKKKPTIIISYIIPGNPYPVTENPQSDKSLISAALQNGAQSHYVVTTSSGIPIEEPQVDCYDELVITQEAQVLPAFVLLIDESNAEDLLRRYHRDVLEKELNQMTKEKIYTL